MTAITAPRHPLVNGKPIRLRWLQQPVHSFLYAFLIALVPAGLYFGALEVHWYLHFGSFYWPGFSNKAWWDFTVGQWLSGHSHGLVTPETWKAYRHAVFRNLLEPTLAFTAVGALNAKPKYWDDKVGPVRIVVTLPLYLLTYLVLAIGGTWLILLNDAHGWHPTNASRGAWDVLQFGILGLGIAFVLHTIYGPVGARAQGAWIERSVDNRFRHRKITLPFWVRGAWVAPTIRERYASIHAADIVSGEAKALSEAGTTRRGKSLYVLAVLALLVIAWLAFLGFVGHIWVGVLGHSFPYLAP